MRRRSARSRQTPKRAIRRKSKTAETPQVVAHPAVEPPAPARPSLSRTQLLLLVLGVVMVFTGQFVLQTYPTSASSEWAAPTLAGLLLIALAFADNLFARLPESIAGRSATVRRWVDPKASRLPLIVAAFLASATAASIVGSGLRMRFPLLSLGFWLAGIGILLYATSAVGRPSGALRRWEFVGLLLLVLAAAVVRILMLDRIPWLLAGDEASVGTSAVEVLRGVWNNPFRVGWYSFPSMFFLLPAASIGAFGQTIEALRLPSAIAGAATVVALYLYARSTFGNTLAFMAAAYLAFFHYHIHFSRIALNNIWDGLFLTLFAYLLWRAWSEERPSLFVWAGMTAGLGLYFYTSARLLAIMVPIWLLVAWLRERAKVRRIGASWLLLVVAAAVVCLPLAVFFASHPGDFMAPMTRVSLLGSWLTREVQLTGQAGWRILLGRLATSALAFTGSNLQHWYKIDHPMLLPLPATLFLVGSVLSLWRALDLRYTWLILWMGAGIVVGGLSESTPAAQRYIFVAPAVALIVTLPLAEVASRFSQLGRRGRTLLAVGLSAVLVLAAALDLRFYFADYTPSLRFSDSNTEVAQNLGFYLKESGLEEQGVQVHFSGLPRMGWKSIETLPYLAPRATYVDIAEPLTAPPAGDITLPAAFVFLPDRLGDLDWIRQAYPNGQVLERASARGGPLYTLYLVR